MPAFSIDSGTSTTYIDPTPGEGLIIDFASLDNSFSVTINGVPLFIGGPGTSPNEVQFQTSGTDGQTVRFENDDLYGIATQQIWQLGNTNGDPVVRLEINPDGTIALSGVRTDNGTLEPLELFNNMSVNTAAIDAIWDDNGPNTIVVDQIITGPTNAAGEITDVLCFASGTMIKTLQGPVRIDDLKVSDLVLTFDHGYQPIGWIGSCDVSPENLETRPNLKPILIRADALGRGFPEQDLVVSPQHRVLVSSAIAMRMFNSKEILVPAKKLLSLDGVEVLEDNPHGVKYWHILFDEHQLIWSNGMPAESLFTGPEALKAVSPEGREEIQALFPQICKPDFEPISARFIPEKGRLLKKFIQRHLDNNKPMYCGA
ncbi:Hint domain-containing protein [Planktotalea sp.]|uniref:Hint domain-containing protein n=1 Tax=Planktotalea sp. TaxID=2029877 RepID=UPI00329A5240